MTPPSPDNPRRAKRVVVLVLVLCLTGLGLYMWHAGVGGRAMFSLLGAGVALGLLCVLRGGSLPPLVHRLAGSSLTRDDDPRNLSPRVYLPILLLALAAAAVAYYLYAPRR